jgi:hypothetical protein
MTTQPPAPDDDNARFAKWVRDVGPMQEMPDVEDVAQPIVMVIAGLVFLAAVAAAVGWVLFGYVIHHLGAWNTTALVLLIVGTVALIVGWAFACLAYLGNRPRRQR